MPLRNHYTILGLKEGQYAIGVIREVFRLEPALNGSVSRTWQLGGEATDHVVERLEYAEYGFRHHPGRICLYSYVCDPGEASATHHISVVFDIPADVAIDRQFAGALEGTLEDLAFVMNTLPLRPRPTGHYYFDPYLKAPLDPSVIDAIVEGVRPGAARSI